MSSNEACGRCRSFPTASRKFDLGGGVFKRVQAPTNLVIPPYRFAFDTRIVIGEE